MLSTKVPFFTQVSTGCEQIDVGKISEDFFGKLAPKTEANCAVWTVVFTES